MNRKTSILVLAVAALVLMSALVASGDGVCDYIDITFDTFDEFKAVSSNCKSCCKLHGYIMSHVGSYNCKCVMQIKKS